MLIIETDLNIVNLTKKILMSKFDTKDMGEVDVILGIKVIRKTNEIILSQAHYVESLLKKYGFYECSPIKIPLEVGSHLIKHHGEPVSQKEYSQIIGSVSYLMNSTRPDIALAVGKLSQHTHNPGKEHWEALTRLLRYLKGTINYGLHYNGNPSVIEGYCDANWISDTEESLATSGYIYTLGGGAISWKSVKQTCGTGSTMEAEFIALEKAGAEAEWLKNLVVEIPLWPKPMPPISLHCDSQAAIAKAKSKIYNGKRRHIRLRHNLVRQYISEGTIAIDFVRSEKNLADIFTKPQTTKVIFDTSKGMSLKPVT